MRVRLKARVEGRKHNDAITRWRAIYAALFDTSQQQTPDPRCYPLPHSRNLAELVEEVIVHAKMKASENICTGESGQFDDNVWAQQLLSAYKEVELDHAQNRWERVRQAFLRQWNEKHSESRAATDEWLTLADGPYASLQSLVNDEGPAMFDGAVAGNLQQHGIAQTGKGKELAMERSVVRYPFLNMGAKGDAHAYGHEEW